MSNPYDTASERLSVLGPTLQFTGELSADEDLVIQGRVDGTILHSQRLTVGPGGAVKATVRARAVVVEGTVDGDVHATKSVVVKETATVRGNIAAPSVSILEGAHFNGAVNMDSRDGARGAESPPAASHHAA